MTPYEYNALSASLNKTFPLTVRLTFQLEFISVGMVVRRMILESAKLDEVLPNEALYTRGSYTIVMFYLPKNLHFVGIHRYNI